MAWDSNRPVPWQRLIREWLIYVPIMALVFLVFMRDSNLLGMISGLLVSGPLYLGAGYVLAKFGYQRKTLKELREQQPAPSRKSKRTSNANTGERPEDGSDSVAPRAKPAPTSRTGGTSNRPGGSRKKKR